mmetsp:Transcript_24932/g.81634  ORF Transcript_24932/g.81634 Transcript_24932/m.81634 type:complete len:201 (-) Transcript_24932:1449-2051(-)
MRPGARERARAHPQRNRTGDGRRSGLLRGPAQGSDGAREAVRRGLRPSRARSPGDVDAHSAAHAPAATPPRIGTGAGRRRSRRQPPPPRVLGRTRAGIRARAPAPVGREQCQWRACAGVAPARCVRSHPRSGGGHGRGLVGRSAARARRRRRAQETRTGRGLQRNRARTRAPQNAPAPHVNPKKVETSLSHNATLFYKNC